jgi:Domain of unknown function (DUF397)
VEVAAINGLIWLRNSQEPASTIVFTRSEWKLFARAVQDGEFDDLSTDPLE